MSTPLFSIIIPTYQSEKTVGLCLESIFSQAFSNFEVIIQDGQSTDQTLQVVQRYNDPRLLVYVEDDHGVYDAMNRALGRVSGEWILFLGSDDRLFESTTLASLATIVAQASADLVYGNVIISGDSHWAKDGEIYRGETDIATLLTTNLSHQSIIYRKKIFEHGLRFNLDYPICADFDLNLRCFAGYRVLYTPLIVTVFATGGTSSQHADQRFERERWENVVKYYGRQLKNTAFIRYKGIFKQTGKALIRKGYYRTGITALSAYLYLKLAKFQNK